MRADGSRRSRRRRLGRVFAVVLVVFGLMVAARPSHIASGPRPPVHRASAVADLTMPPLPQVDERFVTLPFHDELGRPGTWVIPDAVKPLQMVVEREVADRFGLDAVGRSLEQWNDTPGSTFSVVLAGITNAGVDRKLRDGVNRVFIDRRECGSRFLARAHLHPAEVEIRGGRPVAWVTEVDIGVCERLPAELLSAVMRHEIAHVAGLGHQCQPGEECWTPQMGTDNRCRVMATAAYPCQDRTTEDDEALAYLHPRLPRVAGADPAATVAAVSALAFPEVGRQPRVLLTDAEAPVPLRAAASVLAGLESVPHLVTGPDCTTGRVGAELNRLASVDATVVLVGDVARSCEDDLRVGWELEVERLADVADVTRAIAELTTAGPTRLVVVPAEGADAAGVPDATIAVPAAIGLGAPLVVAGEGELTGVVRDVLADVPSITGLVVLGSGHSVSPADVAELADVTGLRVRHIAASDGLELAVKVTRMRDVFGHGPVSPVLVAANRPGDALVATHLAAAGGHPIVPIFTGLAGPDVRVAEFLV
ncbi:MAG: hypothetical protein KY461_15335, partial [Actinobacteria bacterium]|nr:hypothetical protein [Actinomycetota bacterium]